MHRITISAITLLGLFAAIAAGQDKPNLSGKWRINATKSEIHSGKPAATSIVIEQKGPAIHVVKTVKTGEKDQVVEFNCTTDGKDCTSGAAKISLWYDGASLVEMDQEGETAVKSTMTLDPATKTISIEIVYISPQAESDTWLMEKS